MVTKDMYVSKILKQYPQLRLVFSRFGISGCSECLQAKFETLELACQIHQVDLDEFLVALNDYLVEYEKKYSSPTK